MTIRLAASPPSAQLPLQFELQQHIDFEQPRADAGAPVRRVRVVPPVTLVQQLDVDFSDPSGGLGSVGRAELVLTRGNGYRAGEWAMRTIGPDGPLGATLDLTLRGSNPPRSPSAQNDSPPRWVG